MSPAWLDVFDVRKNFFLLVFVEVTHQVYGIIRVHVVHKALGDCFRRDHFEELFTNVLIHFDEYVGRGFIVEQAVDKPGFFGFRSSHNSAMSAG